MFLRDTSLPATEAMKRVASALLLAGALSIAGPTAQAGTITLDFSFICDNCVRGDPTYASAFGSFSYSSTLTGVLDYADLTSFDLDLPEDGDTFDLAFERSGTIFDYFAYDTITNEFVQGTVADDPDFLSSAASGLTAGYFFTPTGFDEYGGGGAEGSYTSIEITPVSAGAPEPASFALVASALLGLGALRCRKRRS
jgi:hypothetical protein